MQRDAQADALYAAYNRQALDSEEKIKVWIYIYAWSLIFHIYSKWSLILHICA